MLVCHQQKAQLTQLLSVDVKLQALVISMWMQLPVILLAPRFILCWWKRVGWSYVFSPPPHWSIISIEQETTWFEHIEKNFYCKIHVKFVIFDILRCRSVTWSVFVFLCNHYHPSPEFFSSSCTETPFPVYNNFLFPCFPSSGNHHCTFCLWISLF